MFCTKTTGLDNRKVMSNIIASLHNNPFIIYLLSTELGHHVVVVIRCHRTATVASAVKSDGSE